MLALASGAPDAGTATVPTVAVPAPVFSPAQQEEALAQLVFLAQRDACVLVEPDAISVNAYGFDRKGGVSRVKTEVARCEPHASVTALLRALGTAIIGAARKQAPAAALPAFDVVTIDDAALAITGKRILVSTTTTAEPSEPLHAYDHVAVRALFDALYVKPNDKRMGTTMRALYDATVRDVVTLLAKDVGLLTAQPRVLAAESKRVMDAARSGKGAQGKDSWRMSLNKLVKSDDDAARIDPRLVGFVLRRQADGTLPIVVDILRTVTTDYAAP